MRRWFVVAIFLIAIGFVFGRSLWQRARGVEVSLVPATRGRLVEAVYATGRVESDQRATVRARRRGPLKALLVGLGEPVKAGQTVALQDDTEARLEVERSRRELEATRAAAAEAEDAARRAASLFREGLLAEGEWVRLRERAAELGKRVAAQEAALAMAEEQLSWFVLRAPLSGTVSQIHRRSGDVLGEGEEVLTVVNLQEAYLRIAVDERDLGKVQPGQEVRMLFDAFPDKPLSGEVWRLVPAVDRLTKSADVLARLPDPRPPLQLEATATVNIVTRVVEDALLVPRNALQGTGKTRTAFRVNRQHRLEAVQVQVGPCDGERCQVLQGLGEGEQVVAEAANLRAGQKVRPR
jgi:RND family efflux transporter MFP subunit